MIYKTVAEQIIINSHERVTLHSRNSTMIVNWYAAASQWNSLPRRRLQQLYPIVLPSLLFVETRLQQASHLDVAIHYLDKRHPEDGVVPVGHDENSSEPIGPCHLRAASREGLEI
jgi:hypothetical protein